VRVGNDLALVQLNQPIRKSRVEPFETEQRPRKGAAVGVVSYGRDRSQSASLQRECFVLARRSGTLVLSCDVDFGSSGAPVFTVDAQGTAKIVSVISAKAEISGREVALGTNLQKPLADLMAMLANSDAPNVASESQVRILHTGGQNGAGAKFLRP